MCPRSYTSSCELPFVNRSFEPLASWQNTTLRRVDLASSQISATKRPSRVRVAAVDRFHLDMPLPASCEKKKVAKVRCNGQIKFGAKLKRQQGLHEPRQGRREFGQRFARGRVHLAARLERMSSTLQAPTFESVQPPLSDASLAAIRAMGFTHMTPVQAATIPLFLTNKDVCVEACTGSGKTIAFLIPIFEMLQRRQSVLPNGHVGAIVISPTRYAGEVC